MMYPDSNRRIKKESTSNSCEMGLNSFSMGWVRIWNLKGLKRVLACFILLKGMTMIMLETLTKISWTFKFKQNQLIHWT